MRLNDYASAPRVPILPTFDGVRSTLNRRASAPQKVFGL